MQRATPQQTLRIWTGSRGLWLGVASLGFLCASAACPTEAPAPEPTAKAKTSPRTPPPDEKPPVEPGKETPTLDAHMKDHFTRASAVRDAVIDGDLPKLRPPATWLAEHAVSDVLPASWKTHIGDMQNAAQLALDAADTKAAAVAVADMAQACGTCHQKLSGPKFTGKSPAGMESSVVADMQRHLWAADRMWEGLVGPSDTAWNAGVAALKDAPLQAKAMADDKTLPKEVFELTNQAHEIGTKGASAQDPEARAGLYAGYLVTCSACHKQVGVQPRKG